MPIKKQMKYSADSQSGWDIAIADAKRRIAELRASIKVFSERKKAGDQWPSGARRAN